MQLNALFRLAFATAPPHGLTLLHRVTRRLIMQKAHGHTVRRRLPSTSYSAPIACRHTVSGSISLSSLESFSPFPHGTCPLSVASEYLALGGGPPGFLQDFSGPVVLWNSVRREHFLSSTGLSPSTVGLSRPFD
jgi:hypothetical protein